MTTLSINLPDVLAKASQEVASQMGISRTEFIRRAVKHELQHAQDRLEEEAMIASIMAMKISKSCRKKTNDIVDALGTADLPEDEDEWWHKKKS